MLDFVIRDATDGRRTIDDVMRQMNDIYGRPRGAAPAWTGFTSADVEHVIERVCGCDVAPFFASYIMRAGSIDFVRYLALAGLTITVTSGPAMRDGRPIPDLRMRTWIRPGETTPRLLLTDPSSVWGRAGLHSRDVVRTFGGAPATDPAAIRQIISRLSIGDSVEVNGRMIVVTGYHRPTVRITRDPAASAKASRIVEAWSRNR
jgi:predicted metalloprotease with PDZ domain